MSRGACLAGSPLAVDAANTSTHASLSPTLPSPPSVPLVDTQPCLAAATAVSYVPRARRDFIWARRPYMKRDVIDVLWANARL